MQVLRRCFAGSAIAAAALFLLAPATVPGNASIGDEPSMKELKKALKSKELHEWTSAIHGLETRGQRGAKALAKALEDRRPEVGLCAASALAKMGRDAEVAVPALIEHMGADSIGSQGLDASLATTLVQSTVSQVTAAALSLSGTLGAPTRPDGSKKQSKKELESKGEWSCAHALIQLGSISLPQLSRELTRARGRAGEVGEDYRRIETVFALAAQKAGTQGHSAVRKALAAKSPRLRAAGALAVGAMAPDAAPLAPHLIPLMSDPVHGVRYRGLEAIARVPVDCERFEGTLRDQLDDPLPVVRVHAARGLVRHCLDGFAAGPVFVACLDVDDTVVRLRALEALRGIDPVPAGAEAAILVCLADRDPVIRREAIGTMSHVAPQSPEFAARLEKLLDDRNESVREAARKAVEEDGISVR